MDRRQRKTREAIFLAFTELLSKKNYMQITVGEIIEKADVGRATFYSHFETKDYLLKELCEELFCHLFDSIDSTRPPHHHIFCCDASDSVYLHLFRHLKNNDNNILRLLSGESNEIFLKYFRASLKEMIIKEQHIFDGRRSEKLPDSFWIDHIISTFVETVRWWVDNGVEQSPETITEYFYLAV